MFIEYGSYVLKLSLCVEALPQFTRDASKIFCDFSFRKRDCLHRFVVVLCERGERLELVEYPYVNLIEEVSTVWYLRNVQYS